ncbi:AAA family ATPase [Methanotorris igneus]|uniref:ATPase associated with various cellular activities AAA_3 n=1 Tax=Methanotorris igneus (strain DSM 5666 / JCM 11834 / Kol 5) TaxID=880724 RepID=F6BAW1_METIK|nr:AAA family ATPase [Methanotorris igneus]AEF97048.1 ATPase associated with various cellular activities AAA_3 [Methanotorris igneus Kol 5]
MNAFEMIKKEIKKNIIGLDDIIRDLFVCLVSEGHILLEGAPGLAKTTLAKSFAESLNLKFSRIQGCPDLLPSDLTGGEIYRLQSGTFEFIEGPIFANIVLVDEINRMSPKTQSGLLEAMEERTVTIGRKTYSLPRPFIVIATQNPVEFEGTYPLSTAQIDRFMMKINMNYLSEEEEFEVLKMKLHNGGDEIKPVVDKEMLNNIIKEITNIHVSLPILKYIKDIIVKTRKDERLILGASTRAGIHLLKVAKVYAYLDNRTYVIPDDVKNNVVKVLSHRLIVDYEEESSAEEILKDILKDVEVPKGDFRFH